MFASSQEPPHCPTSYSRVTTDNLFFSPYTLCLTALLPLSIECSGLLFCQTNSYSSLKGRLKDDLFSQTCHNSSKKSNSFHSYALQTLCEPLYYGTCHFALPNWAHPNIRIVSYSPFSLQCQPRIWHREGAQYPNFSL